MAANNNNQPNSNANISNSTMNLSQPQQTIGGVGNTTTFILNPSSNTSNNSVPSSLQTTGAPISHINQMIASSPLITQQQFQQQNSNQINAAARQQPQQMNGPIMAGPVPTSNIANIKPNNSNTNNSEEQKPNLNELPPNNNDSGDSSKPQTIQNLHPVVVLDKQRLQELVQEVDPNEQLEEEVEDVLLSIADDFIESLVTTSCMISRHRKATTLDVKDVQLALEKNWNMWIPGFGVDGVVGVFSGNGLGQNSALNTRLPKKCMATEAHKQRLALIKKTLKKF